MAIEKSDASTPLSVTQRAVIVQDGRHVLSASVPVPTLDPQSILIKIHAIAINPSDAKMVDIHGSLMSGCFTGYDFSGCIVAVGADANSTKTQSSLLGAGDRVAGLVFGYNSPHPNVGAFCEYVIADPRFVVKLPSSMSFEEGASLGVATATAGMALYQSLGLEMPTETVQQSRASESQDRRKDWVLVLGGSTACGTMAIQLLKLSGYQVIATASPKNHALVRSYGADCIVDYRSSKYADEIKAKTLNSLSIVVDCVSDNESFKTAYEVIGTSGGKYTSLNHFPISSHTRDDVKPHWVFILTMFGQPIQIKGPLNRPKPRLKDREFQTGWFECMQCLLDLGRIRPHPVTIDKAGLEGIPHGIELIRQGRVSATKLVYTISQP